MVRFMANRRVAIYRSAKVNGVWSYYRLVTGRNHKVKPDWCHVNGHTEHHPDSDYIIKWYEGKTQRTRNCKNAADAQSEAEIQRSVLNAKRLGVLVKEPDTPHILLSARNLCLSGGLPPDAQAKFLQQDEANSGRVPRVQKPLSVLQHINAGRVREIRPLDVLVTHYTRQLTDSQRNGRQSRGHTWICLTRHDGCSKSSDVSYHRKATRAWRNGRRSGLKET